MHEGCSAQRDCPTTWRWTLPFSTRSLSLTQTKTRLSLLILALRRLPSKWEPTRTVGGFEAECSLIKDRLITGASQPGFFSADKRIILERGKKKHTTTIEVIPGRPGLLLNWAGRKYSHPPPLSPILSVLLWGAGFSNQGIEYSERLHFSSRTPT